MKNKVFLITGATSMIGRASAHLLAEQGATLVLIGRSLSKLEALAQELNTEVRVHAIDITDPLMVAQAITSTEQEFRRIDCVVLNTAIYPYQAIESLDLLSWNDTLATTLTGPFIITQQCIRVMKKQGFGKFILLSSIAGETIGLPNMSAFATAKAGLNGFMRTAAIEFAKYNINVNSISPGKLFDTETLSTEEIVEKLRPIPLQRFITADDIAEMVLFLASDKANNITGQNFIIDGGQSVLGEDSHLN